MSHVKHIYDGTDYSESNLQGYAHLHASVFLNTWQVKEERIDKEGDEAKKQKAFVPSTQKEPSWIQYLPWKALIVL